MSEVGHNQPPGQIEFSKETATALSDWMKDHPIIDSEETAREAKLLVDRGKACTKDMADERSSRTSPMLKKVEEIRAEYRQPQAILDKVLTELEARLRAFILREEEKRRAEAERLRLEAEEAERVAREAEERERLAKEEAQQGVVDIDIAEETKAADEAFSQYEEAQLALKRAERETKVKIGGGFRRAASLRKHETLIIDDVHKAVDSLGLTEAIRDAILVEARHYRRELGELPDGISSHEERA